MESLDEGSKLATSRRLRLLGLQQHRLDTRPSRFVDSPEPHGGDPRISGTGSDGEGEFDDRIERSRQGASWFISTNCQSGIEQPLDASSDCTRVHITH